jgi:hypothetical protein
MIPWGFANLPFTRAAAQSILTRVAWQFPHALPTRHQRRFSLHKLLAAVADLASRLNVRFAPILLQKSKIEQP